MRRRSTNGFLLFLLILFFSSRQIAAFGIDYVWFQTMGYESAFMTLLLTRYGIALGCFVVVAGVIVVPSGRVSTTVLMTLSQRRLRLRL